MAEKVKRNNCTGKSFFDGDNNLGGHVEDYMSDPQNTFRYPKNLQWVPVSQSFKKD